MAQLDNNSGRYVSLADAAEKYCRFAENDDQSPERNRSPPELEMRLFQSRIIQLADQGKLNLYCFKLIPPRSEERWFILKGLELTHLANILKSTPIYCMPFFDNQSGVVSAINNWKAQPEEKVGVSRSDLYLDPEELAQMAKDNPKFSAIEARTEPDTSKPEGSEIASQSDASKKTYVPLAEMANKWGYEEDDIIQLAIQKEFNLYYLKPLPTQSGSMTTTPHYIGDELDDFLPGKTSISCSRFLVKDCSPRRLASKNMNSEVDKVAALNNMETLDPVVHDISNLNLPPPGNVIVDRSDLYLDRDEINKMEEEYPGLIEEEVKIETDIQPKDINTPSQSDASKA